MKRVKQQHSFCPYCGGEVVLKYVANEGKKREVCSACGRILYHNSKPCVGALIIDEDRILLVKRKQEPYKGYWDIPGGFLEGGEHPENGLLREIREETGLEVRPIKLLGIFMDKYGPDADDTLNIHYLAEVIGGEAKAGSDAGELRWFSKKNLPKRIAFRNGREVLKVWRNMSR
jgi:8-oxo-dGTP diphosphatase